MVMESAGADSVRTQFELFLANLTDFKTPVEAISELPKHGKVDGRASWTEAEMESELVYAVQLYLTHLGCPLEYTMPCARAVVNDVLDSNFRLQDIEVPPPLLTAVEGDIADDWHLTGANGHGKSHETTAGQPVEDHNQPEKPVLSAKNLPTYAISKANELLARWKQNAPKIDPVCLPPDTSVHDAKKEPPITEPPGTEPPGTEDRHVIVPDLPAVIDVKKDEVLPISTPNLTTQPPEFYGVGEYPLRDLVRDAFLVETAPKPICYYCLNNVLNPDQNNRMVKCSGPCMKSFHVQCLTENGHADVDPSQPFKCPMCTTDTERPCFSCKLGGGDVVKCPEKDCGEFYHRTCLMGKDGGSDSPTKKLRACPLHHCHTCARVGRDSKTRDMDKSTLAKCHYCPIAYHFNFMCFPAETTINPENAKVMTCFKHRDLTKAASRGKKKVTWKKSTINPNVCFFCKKGGELLVCDTCPFTADKECAGLEEVPAGPWRCADCTKGAKPMILDIVWYKTKRYRVWPCQILPEQMVPPNVLHHQPVGSGFVLRYLGTNEYAFAVSAEVLPYEIYDPKWKYHPTKENRFPEGLLEAMKLSKDLLAIKTGMLMKLFAGKRPVYTRIRSNRPVPPVEYITSVKKEDVHICDCKVDDQDPCGPTSNCLNRDMEYECSPKYCPTGDACKNQRIGRKEYPKMDIFYTANRGWALRVLQDVKKGDLVVEYVGEIITNGERNRRIKEKLATGDANFYFLDLNNARVIDAGPAGNLARFANHSCDANTFSQKWVVQGDTHIGLIATRDIPSGSEITFDYRWEYESGVTSRECLCGADNCPGMIGGKTYDPAVGKQLPSVSKKTKRSSISPASRKRRSAGRQSVKKSAAVLDTSTVSDASVSSGAANPPVPMKKRSRESIVPVSNKRNAQDFLKAGSPFPTRPLADVTIGSGSSSPGENATTNLSTNTSDAVVVENLSSAMEV